MMTEDTEALNSEKEQLETESLAEEKVESEPQEEQRKKRSDGVFQYYKVQGEDLKRLRPFCERCGPGYFMADHGNRYTCGHCGFTRYKQVQE
jgi:small subunit ribosomal protein S27Ae